MRPLPIEAGGDDRCRRTLGAIRDRAKARGLAVLTIEAGADAGQVSDVGGSETPTSPACERRRNDPARDADRTALTPSGEVELVVAPTAGSGGSTGD